MSTDYCPNCFRYSTWNGRRCESSKGGCGAQSTEATPASGLPHALRPITDPKPAIPHKQTYQPPQKKAPGRYRPRKVSRFEQMMRHITRKKD